jgi:hypothetical protein
MFYGNRKDIQRVTTLTFDKTKYEIRPIDYKTAMDLVVEFHYLHRKAPCSQAFGLFNTVDTWRENDKPLGVITYGTPASRSLQKGLCGEEEANNVVELTRLWVMEGTPKNAESFLIANSMKLVGKEILVSYAEVDQGHLGIVYQATNWIYTGLSDRHIKWTIEGTDDKHCRHIFDSYGGINKAKKVLGDKMKRGERPRKHRYVFFNTSNKRRRELLSKLRYVIKPYPKNPYFIRIAKKVDRIKTT